MLCQHCKKNTATIDCTEIINGKVYGGKYCKECYHSLFGELDSPLNTGMWAALFADDSGRAKVCPVCGTTYADYEHTGLLGCASCYDVFRTDLMPSIRRIQGKTQHVGKMGKNDGKHDIARELKNLQERFEQAIKSGNRAEAGKLNGRINELTKLLYDDDDYE